MVVPSDRSDVNKSEKAIVETKELKYNGAKQRGANKHFTNNFANQRDVKNN